MMLIKRIFSINEAFFIIFYNYYYNPTLRLVVDYSSLALRHGYVVTKLGDEYSIRRIAYANQLTK